MSTLPAVVVVFVLGALRNAGFPTQSSGVLDDAAFPAEERTTLSTIMMPVLVEANASTGTAVLRDPGAGVSFTASVGETARDYVLVAILPGANASAVLERRFVAFDRPLLVPRGLAPDPFPIGISQAHLRHRPLLRERGPGVHL